MSLLYAYFRSSSRLYSVRLLVQVAIVIRGLIVSELDSNNTHSTQEKKIMNSPFIYLTIKIDSIYVSFSFIVIQVICTMCVYVCWHIESQYFDNLVATFRFVSPWRLFIRGAYCFRRFRRYLSNVQFKRWCSIIQWTEFKYLNIQYKEWK